MVSMFAHARTVTAVFLHGARGALPHLGRNIRPPHQGAMFSKDEASADAGAALGDELKASEVAPRPDVVSIASVAVNCCVNASLMRHCLSDNERLHVNSVLQGMHRHGQWRWQNTLPLKGTMGNDVACVRTPWVRGSWLPSVSWANVGGLLRGRIYRH